MNLAAEAQSISSVLICEDHPFTQAGLAMTLRSFLPHHARIHQALTGKAALDVARDHRPDFAIIDLELPDLTGLDTLRELQRLSPQTRILVLTNCQNPSTLRQVHGLNVKAISHKSSPMEEFSMLFNKVFTSRATILDPFILRLLDQNQHLHFTPKELEVLEKIAQGYSNQKIADEIGCALTTVRFHRANIMQKGGFRNAAEVTAWFLKGKGQPNLCS
ncbi:MAG: response regulator transcription factor [Bdellovibrionaceae bacterium]|nr:response regulator transcription factor [Pseudobdellovibrionaceae bacterium]